jgi:cytochrome c oxidase cbb3-type subunit I/II
MRATLFLAGLAMSFTARAEDAQLAKGKTVFLNNCVACHGVDGDGRGPASVAIAGAKPRDFTKGVYKYGDRPEQMFETISKGVPGTAMPPWASLPEDERRAVIQYVLSLKKKP